MTMSSMVQIAGRQMPRCFVGADSGLVMCHTAALLACADDSTGNARAGISESLRQESKEQAQHASDAKPAKG